MQKDRVGSTGKQSAPFRQTGKEEVVSKLIVEGGALRSVLLKPPFPLMKKVIYVLLPGSGDVDFDGDLNNPLLFGNGYQGRPAKLSLQLAEALVEQGYASYRYTKRGVIDSTLNAQEQTSKESQVVTNLVKDAKLAVEQVQKEYPDHEIGVIGFSEGALLAVNVATEMKLNALYLLGMPTDSIDQTFEYQFLKWPLNLLKKQIDEKTQKIKAVPIPMEGLFNAFLNKTYLDFDSDQDGYFTLTDLEGAYKQLHEVVIQVMRNSEFTSWYEDFKKQVSMEDLAKKVHVPIYAYYGANDAQVNPQSSFWKSEKQFSGLVGLRIFSELGHCFSPYVGGYGEVKTSGPFSDSLLEQLILDINQLN